MKRNITIGETHSIRVHEADSGAETSTYRFFVCNFSESFEEVMNIPCLFNWLWP